MHAQYGWLLFLLSDGQMCGTAISAAAAMLLLCGLLILEFNKLSRKVFCDFPAVSNHDAFIIVLSTASPVVRSMDNCAQINYAEFIVH